MKSGYKLRSTDSPRLKPKFRTVPTPAVTKDDRTEIVSNIQEDAQTVDAMKQWLQVRGGKIN